MKTIWKFELRLTDDQAVEMPAGAELLTVQLQGDTPCLWAVVDPYAPPGRRRIYIRGTGHSLRLTDDTRYLGTVQLHGGILVLHYFDGGELASDAEDPVRD